MVRMRRAVVPFRDYDIKVCTVAHFMRHFWRLVEFGAAVWDGEFPDVTDGRLHAFIMRIDDDDLLWHCKVSHM